MKFIIIPLQAPPFMVGKLDEDVVWENVAYVINVKRKRYTVDGKNWAPMIFDYY